jgi:uncharacterized protein (TIGR02646 family)
MKYIQKGSEPEEFATWKSIQRNVGVNCNYKSLQNPEKNLVHESLLSEQGSICCYCCDRISKNRSHIEHLNAQSENDDDSSIDYNNMLASCGSSERWPKHCGNKKGKNQIEITPLQVDCENFFAYSVSGKIVAASELSQLDEKKAKDTIDILGLNHTDLEQSRKRAWEALQGITDEEAHKIAQACKQKNSQGQYRPFANAVLYYLQQLFRIQV